MRRRIYIPNEVRQSIKDHIQHAVENARDGYLSANEDEDTMTGHLGALLRIGKQSVSVSQSEISGDWKWSIDYFKFRGRGPKATEKTIGADGVFELQLSIGAREEIKSLLFQSKMDLSRDKSLAEQCIRLSTWREAAFVVNYKHDAFEAFSIDDVIRSRGSRPKSSTSLADYLCDNFVDCLVGDSDLLYDAKSRKLQWRTIDGEVVATSFSLTQRISVNVEAPKIGRRDSKIDNVIPNGEIHNYRMEATEEEILSVSNQHTADELKAAMRSLSLVYHPDYSSTFDSLTQQILKRRMQEINKAYEEVKNRRK